MLFKFLADVYSDPKICKLFANDPEEVFFLYDITSREKEVLRSRDIDKFCAFAQDEMRKILTEMSTTGGNPEVKYRFPWPTPINHEIKSVTPSEVIAGDNGIPVSIELWHPVPTEVDAVDIHLVRSSGIIQARDVRISMNREEVNGMLTLQEQAMYKVKLVAPGYEASWTGVFRVEDQETPEDPQSDRG